MKKIVILLISAAAALSGCRNFLDVNPKSKLTDDDMFSNSEGVEDALYGIYAVMGYNIYLYSQFLTIYLPEFSSGNFYYLKDAPVSNLALGNWDQGNAYVDIGQCWLKAYEAIGYTNNIINHFEDGDVAEMRNHDLYYGEALALRALIHFDLMRVFGPAQWSTDQSAKDKVIPYVKKYSAAITPFSTLDQVYDQVIDDLSKAESLLGADAELLPAERDNTPDGFTSCRILHMNLYAVQALLARVYWTRGDLANAAAYADKVIESGKFPLMTTADFNDFECGVINMKEAVFGLYSEEYGRMCNKYFNKKQAEPVEISDYRSLYALDPSLGTDLRYKAWFTQYGSLYDDTFDKMINKRYLVSTNATYDGPSIEGINMIRIPEMYYIAAEYRLSVGDIDKAIEYLDRVIVSRGMVGFAERVPKSLTMDDLYDEYKKEFFGEGMQWYNMKRLKKNIKLKNSVITASDKIYIVPIPAVEETDKRTD